ncbi:hypothetical protein [Acetatifactor aquisgranensis]|uniref:hypothetical protein n=1 Tax=Acetatifactor aquisgranensis TaxID=2941233 RepID=UPI00203F1A30|nr:hypothetical protein [Acetatifactor aquisgranensis]
MAKNDGMDALGALVGLGVLGSILEGVSDADMVRKMTASGRSPFPAQEQQQRKATTPAEGAKAAKEIYDSYVAAGFNEVQAFELLKAVLTAHKTN